MGDADGNGKRALVRLLGLVLMHEGLVVECCHRMSTAAYMNVR